MYLVIWQLATDVVCGVDFSPLNPDVLAMVGKECVSWWRIYINKATITLDTKADYQVKIYRCKLCSTLSRYYKCKVIRECYSPMMVITFMITKV